MAVSKLISGSIDDLIKVTGKNLDEVTDILRKGGAEIADGNFSWTGSGKFKSAFGSKAYQNFKDLGSASISDIAQKAGPTDEELINNLISKTREVSDSGKKFYSDYMERRQPSVQGRAFYEDAINRTGGAPLKPQLNEIENLRRETINMFNGQDFMTSQANYPQFKNTIDTLDNKGSNLRNRILRTGDNYVGVHEMNTIPSAINDVYPEMMDRTMLKGTNLNNVGIPSNISKTNTTGGIGDKVDGFLKKAVPIGVGGGLLFTLFDRGGQMSNSELYGQTNIGNPYGY